MPAHRNSERAVVVVVGCDDVGSAIAHAMHVADFAVVLVDDIDPPWIRRGRSYTDAWYVGGATLEGVDACFCGSVRSIPAFGVDAVHSGRFRTRREIAERVNAGDVLGDLDRYAIVAPATGVLAGLAARGARVAAGQLIAEIDPCSDPQRSFGIAAEERAIARRVCAAVRGNPGERERRSADRAAARGLTRRRSSYRGSRVGPTPHARVRAHSRRDEDLRIAAAASRRGRRHPRDARRGHRASRVGVADSSRAQGDRLDAGRDRRRYHDSARVDRVLAPAFRHVMRSGARAAPSC